MTTISLPEDLVERLRKIAEERHVSIEDVIREAIKDDPARRRVKPRILGMGDSGRSDLSVLASDLPFEPRSWH